MCVHFLVSVMDALKSEFKRMFETTFQVWISFNFLTGHLYLGVDIQKKSVFCVLHDVVSNHKTVDVHTGNLLLQVFRHGAHAREMD